MYDRKNAHGSRLGSGSNGGWMPVVSVQTWNEGAKLVEGDEGGYFPVAALSKNERGYGEWVQIDDHLRAVDAAVLRELRALLEEQHGERGDHDSYRVVPVDAITDRIAAIEAEEATPLSASE